MIAPQARNFFIIGCDRSGTSLLSRMLNSHPEVGVPFESHIFNHLYALRFRYGDLLREANVLRLARDMVSLYEVRHWDFVPHPVDIAASTTNPSFCGVFDALMRVWRDHHGKAIWGEKSPNHIEYWEVLTGYYADPPLLHIVRDGRDVALSLVAARFGPKTIYTAMRYWTWYLGLVENARRQSSCPVLDLRYEDLLGNPRAELERVCRFLNIEYSAAMLDFHRDLSPYDTDARNLRNLRRPLLTDNAGWWQRELDGHQVVIAEALGAEMLKRYGYDLTVSGATLGQLEHYWRERLEWRPKRALALLRNWRRGTQEAYAMSRIRLRLARESLLE